MPTHSQANDLFARAYELSGEARETFLAEACGDDADLHLRVRGLLAAALKADSFFGDSDGATIGAEEFAETHSEQEGDEVGPYILRQKIGEGGFGLVWMAEQREPISRRVALKVIKAGMDTRQVLARFGAERQALAMMDHPHIAKVLDAGATATGRPWFAMELVKGVPITQFCDEQSLGTRERLALFRDVCAAINHAHQKGVIHRDIKPSNVMVTLHGDQPVVKVIDFGIAKATHGRLTDQTLFTRFEQMIGTPVYMSPEQAGLSGLDIDTRSDIYALGVLLYELLAGQPPFDSKSLLSAGYEEMRRIIREVEPAKPSSRVGSLVGEARTTLAKAHRIGPEMLSRLVAPDLDWIVMKAIEKDRSRRYETANAFAQDIVRFLTDEPVTATPPSAGYRLRKFAKRNRRQLLSGALASAALLAGLAVAAGIWLDSSVEKSNRVARAGELIEQAEDHWAQNTTADSDEDEHFLLARGLVSQAKELLVGINGSGGEVRQRQAELVTAIDSEERDRRFVAEIQEALMKSVSFGGGTDTLIEAIARSFQEVGINPLEEPAQDTVSRVMQRREALRDWMVIGLVRWAESLEKTGPEQAAQLKAVIRKCDLDPWRDKLLEAIEKQDSGVIESLAEAPELRKQPTKTILWLSWTLTDHELLDASEKLLRRAQRAAPADFWTNFFLGMNLAMAGSDESMTVDGVRGFGVGTAIDIGSAPGGVPSSKTLNPRMTDAIGFLRAATAARRDAGIAWMMLGVLVSSVGYGSDAIACFEQAVVLNPDDAALLGFLGMGLLGEGRNEEALAVARRAVELDPAERNNHSLVIGALAKLGRDEEALAACQRVIELGLDGGMAYVTLGATQMTRGDTEQALASYRLGIAVNPSLAELHNGLGMVLWLRGESAAAIVSYDEAIKLAPDLAAAHNGRGLVLMQRGGRGGIAGAIASFRKAIELDSGNAQNHSNLGMALTQMKEYEAAIISLKEAIALSPGFAMALSNLGSIYDRLDRPEDAIKAYKNAIAADPSYSMAHNKLGLMLWKQGRHQEAIAAYQGSNDPAAHCGLGVNLEKLGMPAEAINAYQRALELKPDYPEALNNLALAYLKADQGGEALPVLEKVLASLQKGFEKDEAGGPESLGDLAVYYSMRGRPEEALTLGETLLSKARKNHGEEAPETLEAMRNLAGLHLRAGRLDEGFKMLEAMLAIRKRTLGTEDPVTLQTMNRMAIEYKKAGHQKRALELQEEALETIRRVLPNDQPLLLDAVELLAILCDRTGQDGRVLKLKEEGLELSRKVRGEEDERTLAGMTTIAISLAGAGRIDEAIAMEEKALEIKRRVMPEEHPILGMGMGLLGDLYVEKGRIADGLALHEDLLALRRREFGPAHADTIFAMKHLLEVNIRVGELQRGARSLAEHLEHLRRAGNGPDSELQVMFRGVLSELADQQTAGLIQPEAIARYYEQNQGLFRETSVHLHMITIMREEEQAARTAQRKEVEALRDRIESGAPFAEVAKQHSVGPYKEDGGDRGRVRRGQTLFDEPLEKAIFAMEPGTTSIYETEKLLLILKVEDRVRGGVAPLGEVREEIAVILSKPLREKLLTEWLEEGRKAVAGQTKEPGPAATHEEETGGDTPENP